MPTKRSFSGLGPSTLCLTWQQWTLAPA